MKVYLAGPFFNESERNSIEKAKEILLKKGLSLFVPMEHKIEDAYSLPNDVWSRLVFEMDRDAIYDCEVVVCIYSGLYGDTGTAWEVGFAKALGKKIVVVHTEYNDFASLMINNSADYNLQGIDSLDKFDFEHFDNNNSNVNNEQR